jgi:hypothetical protein
MGMGADIISVYRRAGAFARAMPLIVVLPLVVELVRQLIAMAGSMPGRGLLAFTVLNTLAMLTVLLFSTRWWRLGGDPRRIWAIGARALLGVVAFITIQLFDEFLFTMGGHMLANFTGQPLFRPGAQLFWMLASVPLYPWYVALLTDDRLSFAESVRAIRPRWLYGFAVVLASVAPLVAIGIVLRVIRGVDPGLGWQGSMALCMALLTATMMVITDSAYFAVYRMVRPARGGE